MRPFLKPRGSRKTEGIEVEMAASSCRKKSFGVRFVQILGKAQLHVDFSMSGCESFFYLTC